MYELQLKKIVFLFVIFDMDAKSEVNIFILEDNQNTNISKKTLNKRFLR